LRPIGILASAGAHYCRAQRNLLLLLRFLLLAARHQGKRKPAARRR
jgi:hypothetical protein